MWYSFCGWKGLSVIGTQQPLLLFQQFEYFCFKIWKYFLTFSLRFLNNKYHFKLEIVSYDYFVGHKIVKMYQTRNLLHVVKFLCYSQNLKLWHFEDNIKIVNLKHSTFNTHFLCVIYYGQFENVKITINLMSSSNDLQKITMVNKNLVRHWALPHGYFCIYWTLVLFSLFLLWK